MSTPTPSDPPALVHVEKVGYPETEAMSAAPLAESVKDESESSISEGGELDLHERLRAMESKMIAVDKLSKFHGSMAEAMQYSQDDPEDPWADNYLLAPEYRDKLQFYTDVLFFMRKVRKTHEELVRIDRQDAARREALRKTDYIGLDDRREKSSIEAFMEGERVKLMQIEWDEYIFRSPQLPRLPNDEPQFAPVEVISGEFDSRTILQLSSTTGVRSINYFTKRSPVERIAPNIETSESTEHQPLPERIRIHSAPLLAIFSELDLVGRSRPPPNPNAYLVDSKTFLRPYQEFSYKYQQLKEWLAMLEKRFENYDDVKRHSSSPEETHGEDDSQRNRMDNPDETPSTLEPDRSDKEAPMDRNVKAESVDVDAPAPVESHSSMTAAEKSLMTSSRTYKLSRSVSALLHLRCLMEFIEKEIKPKQDYISSPECTHIHFHDLWHLFKPGDEVIQQDGKQAFIILRVQVPKHKLVAPWNRWNRENDSDDSSDSDSDSGHDEDEDNEVLFRIHCAYIDFDGKNFGPVSKKFKISPFGDSKLISSLPVYPLRSLKKPQARQNLVERGRLLLKISRYKAMYYAGVTLDKRDEIDSQVVIDFNEALSDDARRKAWEPTIGALDTAGDRLGSPCTAICCQYRNVVSGSEIDSKMTEDHIKSLFSNTSMGASSLILQPRSLEEVLSSPEKLTETELLIMTYRVFGFVLRSRKWAQLDLSLLRYENSNARDITVDAFEGLELPDNHREVLKSLVVQHFRSKQSAYMRNEQTDLIQGKGKGLILLLHGAPGVGKTTTAEGIAEVFRKPLFQITCGDLGTTAREVETELEKNFSLASRWGCILLLDEADVFLSAREKMDFTRNGLVAVFLRVLEYYSGILFLTTNRIGDFDEAFSSRIHMSLYYPPLNEDKTLKVFQLNLDLIKKRFIRQGRSITFDASAVEKFAREHFRIHKYNRWNGRQIRNACQTALALAEFDSQGSTLDIEGAIDKTAVVELQQKYFETVQKAYLAFDEYLGDIQGTKGDSRAIDYKLRARTDTPYQSKRGANPQHESYSSQRGQQSLRTEYPHAHRTSSNMSQTNFGLQGDPFEQNYTPATPNANMSRSQSYEPYQSHASQTYPYHGQSRGGPATSRDVYDRSPEGNQQYQAGHRSSQGVTRTQQFEPSRVGSRIMPSIEDEHYPSPGYDDSPRPYRGSQRQPQGYDYDHPDDGGIAQNPTPPTQGSSSYNPNAIFRPRRDDAGN